MTRRLFLLMALLFSAALMAAEDAATTLVRETSDRMLSALKSHRAEIDRNPSRIYGLVDNILVPHFDFEKITRAALGPHWRKATSAQQSALIDAFRELLIRTYAQALLNYSGQKIRYLPVRRGQRKDMVTVSTEVREPGGPPLPIDYRMYLKGGEWKVYDVVIDHASLVSNYRSSFDTRIRRNGIDGLIARLNEMNRKGEG
jgi:phospholipid transport system substrate-binding protein